METGATLYKGATSPMGTVRLGNGVAFYENGRTVSIITVRTVGTGATYLIVVAREFYAG